MTHSVLIHPLCRFSFSSLLPNLVLLFGRNQFTGLSGPQFLILYPASLSSASSASSIICHTIFVTHHHSHITFCHPAFTHHFCHTAPSTHKVSETLHFTYNLLCHTPHRLHTTVSLAMLHTPSLSQRIFHTLSL